MKHLIAILALALLAGPAFAQVNVRGYYRSNGTYVQPYQRTRPDNSIYNNYSYPGNYNPNSGRITGGNSYATPSYSMPSMPQMQSMPSMPSMNSGYGYGY